MVPPVVHIDLRRAPKFSRHNHQRRIKHSTLLKIAEQRGKRAVEFRHEFIGIGWKQRAVVVPGIVALAYAHKSDPRLHQSPREQCPLAHRRLSILLPQCLRLFGNLKCLLRPRRLHQIECRLIVTIESLKSICRIVLADLLIHQMQQTVAPLHASPIHSHRQFHIAHGILRGTRIPGCKRVVLRPQKSRPGIVAARLRHNHIGRQFVARTQFLVQHASHAWYQQRRQSIVPAQHQRLRRSMRRLLVRHRPDQCQLVHQLRRPWQMLRNMQPRNRSRNRSKRSAVLAIRFRLQIKGVEMA